MNSITGPVLKSKLRVHHVPSFHGAQCPVDVPVVEFLIDTIEYKSTTLDIELKSVGRKLNNKLAGNKECKVRPHQRVVRFERNVFHVQARHSIKGDTCFQGEILSHVYANPTKRERTDRSGQVTVLRNEVREREAKLLRIKLCRATEDKRDNYIFLHRLL